MNSDNISSHELDEWEDACRYHSDTRSLMILRLIAEVRQCWDKLNLETESQPGTGRADLKLVVNGTQKLSKGG